MGVLVDSSVGFNAMDLTGKGAVVNYSGLGNVFASARPDVGPTAFSAGALRFRFVDSVSGAPTSVGSASIWAGVNESNIATHTVSFFNLSGVLVYSQTFTSAGQTVSATSPSGISRIEVTTNFSVLADNLTFSYVPSQN